MWEDVYIIIYHVNIAYICQGKKKIRRSWYYHTGIKKERPFYNYTTSIQYTGTSYLPQKKAEKHVGQC